LEWRLRCCREIGIESPPEAVKGNLGKIKSYMNAIRLLEAAGEVLPMIIPAGAGAFRIRPIDTYPVLKAIYDAHRAVK